MAPVGLLDPRPGERICDLCAAPGGKSTQIAGKMAGEGFLLCNEYNPKRAKILGKNIERMGVANALVVNAEPRELARKFPGWFDRVLVDAPCSGEGMFRKEEAAVTDWSEETVEMCARRQGEILDSAALLVKPGGRLVYSTCTFAPAENEEAVKAFLERNPDFSPEEVNAPWFTQTGTGMFRLWPHKVKGEGHFAAVLRKTGGEEDAPAPLKGQSVPKLWEAFARENEISLPAGKALLFGQTLYWVHPEMPDLKGLRVIRAGIELGEVKKDRFEPAHALALWLKKAKNTVSYSADSGEIAAYMNGQTLPCGKKGWTLVQVDGYSLGWGKADGTVLKNHYPKGLRR